MSSPTIVQKLEHLLERVRKNAASPRSSHTAGWTNMLSFQGEVAPTQVEAKVEPSVPSVNTAFLSIQNAHDEGPEFEQLDAMYEMAEGEVLIEVQEETEVDLSAEDEAFIQAPPESGRELVAAPHESVRVPVSTPSIRHEDAFELETHTSLNQEHFTERTEPASVARRSSHSPPLDHSQPQEIEAIQTHSSDMQAQLISPPVVPNAELFSSHTSQIPTLPPFGTPESTNQYTAWVEAQPIPAHLQSQTELDEQTNAPISEERIAVAAVLNTAAELQSAQQHVVVSIEAVVVRPGITPNDIMVLVDQTRQAKATTFGTMLDGAIQL